MALASVSAWVMLIPHPPLRPLQPFEVPKGTPSLPLVRDVHVCFDALLLFFSLLEYFLDSCRAAENGVSRQSLKGIA